MPLDALDELLDVREKLGRVHIGLHDWGAARRDLESVLGQDPGRVSTLEQLTDVYLRLQLFEEAATSCEHLSRLHGEMTKRAGALFRRGEILHDELGDEPRAFDSWLKASDLDPTFVPTSVRLATAFWLRGAFDDVADMADEITKAGAMADLPLTLRLRLTAGVALAQGSNARELALAALPWLASASKEAAAVLLEATEHLSKDASWPERQTTLSPLLTGDDALGLDDVARSALSAARASLAAELASNPAATSVARLLGWMSPDQNSSQDLGD